MMNSLPSIPFSIFVEDKKSGKNFTHNCRSGTIETLATDKTRFTGRRLLNQFRSDNQMPSHSHLTFSISQKDSTLLLYAQQSNQYYDFRFLFVYYFVVFLFFIFVFVFFRFSFEFHMLSIPPKFVLFILTIYPLFVCLCSYSFLVRFVPFRFGWILPTKTIFILVGPCMWRSILIIWLFEFLSKRIVTIVFLYVTHHIAYIQNVTFFGAAVFSPNI